MNCRQVQKCLCGKGGSMNDSRKGSRKLRHCSKKQLNKMPQICSNKKKR